MQKDTFGGVETVWQGRIGYVAEYGAAIAWFRAKASSYMSGAIVDLDRRRNFKG